MAIELGGEITLKGFGDLDGGELVVVKKLVGRYARKLSENSNGYKGLTVTMKPVHKTENSQKYELHAMADLDGDQITSEVTDRNLFMALDDVLQKVLTQAN